MTPDELDAIEARWFLGDVTPTDLPALVAALREAWAEAERMTKAATGYMVERDLLTAENERLRAELVNAPRWDALNDAQAAIARVEAVCDDQESRDAEPYVATWIIRKAIKEA